MSNGISAEQEACRAIEAQHPGWACWVNLYGDWLARTVGSDPKQTAMVRITKESCATPEERAAALVQAIIVKEDGFGPVQ